MCPQYTLKGSESLLTLNNQESEVLRISVHVRTLDTDLGPVIQFELWIGNPIPFMMDGDADWLPLLFVGAEIMNFLCYTTLIQFYTLTGLDRIFCHWIALATWMQYLILFDRSITCQGTSPSVTFDNIGQCSN